MDPIGSGQPRHIIHGVAGAFNLNSGGTPASFKFGFGCYGVAADGVGQYGIIQNCTISPLGEEDNLKDEVGSTHSIMIKDPGWQASFSMVHAIAQQAPSRGDVILITPNVDEQAGADPYKVVITSVTFKWEQEGWRGLEIVAKGYDSLNQGDSYGVTLTDTGTVGGVIYSPPETP